MSHDIETAWIGRANEVRRALTKGGAELSSDEKNAVSKVEARFSRFSADTAANPTIISYSGGVVSIRFGRIPGVEPGTHRVTLVVFDPIAAEGYNWGFFTVNVMR